MRIALLAFGTRGDVQPAVALALGLERAGHTVRLAAPPLSRDLVVSRGLEYAPLGPPPDANRDARAPSMLWTLGFILRVVRLYIRSLSSRGSPPAWPVRVPYLERVMEDSWSACRDAQAVIFPFMAIWLYHIVEKTGVPYALWDTHPFTATGAFPSFSFTGIFPAWFEIARRLPGWFRPGGGFNALTHRVVERLLFHLGLRLTNTWRQESLGLSPLTDITPFGRFYREGATVLYCWSPLAIPEPPDWPASHHATGYWFLDSPAGWRPPADLVDFLSAGPPPVCVGFGSSRDRNPKRLTDIILDALARTGQRGILLTGRGGMTRVKLPENVFLTDDVPHDWLFPRVAAVVHHGGAGTTGAVLRAGVPSVVVPWWGDMPFWADRLWKLGVSPRPIRKGRLSPPRLAAAIHAAVNDPRLRDQAAALAQRIRAEDGVSRAVAIFERSLTRTPERTPVPPTGPGRPRNSRPSGRDAGDWT